MRTPAVELTDDRDDQTRNNSTEMTTQIPDRDEPTDESSTDSDPAFDSRPAIDRRTLLKSVGLGAAAGMAGCQEVIGRRRETPADEHVPFDVWEELRTALRTSPDHLPARAKQLVAEGDPEAIFRFVRDEIVTYPAAVDARA